MIKRSQVRKSCRQNRVPLKTALSGRRSCQSPSIIAGASELGRVINIYLDSDQLVLVLPDKSAANGIRYRRINAEYSCFIHTSNLSRDLERAIKSNQYVKGISHEGKWLRIYWSNREACKQYCKGFHQNGIQTYEGNINPVLRYMADNDVQIKRPRIAYIDIETDSRIPFSRKEEMRILSWVIEDENGNVETGLLRSDTDKAERRLLTEMWTILDNYDLVVAWNGDRFDFPVMKARSIDRGFRYDTTWQWDRWLWLDHLLLFRRMNTMAAESGEEKQSYALGNVAQVILGEGKDNFDASKTWEAWKAGGKRRNRLLKYNIKDTHLLKQIEDKTGYIELLITLGEACGTFSNTRGANPTIQVESFFQRLAVNTNHKFPTVLKYGKEKGEQYKGAFVMEPTTSGIVKGVHVADFSSLYPTVIKTWNMSPETVVGKTKDLKQTIYNKSLSYSPLTDVFFDNNKKGILPTAINELLRLRKHWNDQKAKAVPGTAKWKDADRKSTAYKIAANSFYGVIGTPVSRFFDRDVAESVTQCAVWLIKESIQEANNKGFDVIYCDTDSIFVRGVTDNEFKRFVEYCNKELYPTILKGVGCINNNINLAYEKKFERIIFTSAKRYIGRYAHYKGTKATVDSKPEVKGLEYKRGDSIRLARKLQEEVVTMLVGGHGGIEDPIEFEMVLSAWLHRILKKKLTLDDIVISKRLSRDLDKYVRRLKKDGTYARQLPHIEMGRVLEGRGRDVKEGAKIDYIILDGSTKPLTVIPAEDWTGRCDRYAIWDSLVYPPTYRLLSATFPGHKPVWDRYKRSRPK